MINKDVLTVNTIRLLSAEAVQKANSGHPGLPMGAAPMAYALWAKNMTFNPGNPKWLNRDRFVLSAGHGSMLLYSLLHLFEYGLSIEDLKNFRQYGSKTPGHPEYGHTVGVEVTTGPLGQGIASGVGMAMAEAHLAARFNRPGFNLVDTYTYVISGDGCLMEGVASEAASLAGTLKLGKLILLYDSNSITIEGGTKIAFREDVAKRFEAYGWQVLKVQDGNDIDAIDHAIKSAKSDSSRPSIIIVTTQIGYGCPAKQGKASAHGEPLGEENLQAAKSNLGWLYEEPFHVPAEVREHLSGIIQEGAKREEAWKSLLQNYKKQYPELAAEWELWHYDDLSGDLLEDAAFWQTSEKANATRSSSGDVLNRLVKMIPNLIGGSADLAPSTKTMMSGQGDFSPEDYSGSNLHFGVREHAMAAIANGMVLYGGLTVYVATFLVFCDYMKPAMRMAAIMGLPVIYVLTHDSIGVGEDGPTHQPIEQLASLRSIPNLTVFRPADTKETLAGWYAALTRKKSPTALILTRQNLPQLQETGKEALKGAYILMDSGKPDPDILLMASGSEVQLIHEAGKKLKTEGIDARVISVPSWELFEEQTEEYKNQVLPRHVRARLVVEAGSSFGWHKYAGLDGDILSIDSFGASAPAEMLFKKFGFTVDNVVARARNVLKR
jgi:transketolase